jgi:hypothetical protein
MASGRNGHRAKSFCRMANPAKTRTMTSQTPVMTVTTLLGGAIACSHRSVPSAQNVTVDR